MHTVREPEEVYALKTLTHYRIVTPLVAELCAHRLCSKGKKKLPAFIPSRTASVIMRSACFVHCAVSVYGLTVVKVGRDLSGKWLIFRLFIDEDSST